MEYNILQLEIIFERERIMSTVPPYERLLLAQPSYRRTPDLLQKSTRPFVFQMSCRTSAAPLRRVPSNNYLLANEHVLSVFCKRCNMYLRLLIVDTETIRGDSKNFGC